MKGVSQFRERLWWLWSPPLAPTDAGWHFPFGRFEKKHMGWGRRESHRVLQVPSSSPCAPYMQQFHSCVLDSHLAPALCDKLHHLVVRSCSRGGAGCHCKDAQLIPLPDGKQQGQSPVCTACSKAWPLAMCHPTCCCKEPQSHGECHQSPSNHSWDAQGMGWRHVSVGTKKQTLSLVATAPTVATWHFTLEAINLTSWPQLPRYVPGS